jgi:hypothetical protein
MQLPNFLRSYCSKNGHTYENGALIHYAREYAPQKGNEVFLVRVCFICGKDDPSHEKVMRWEEK